MKAPAKERSGHAITLVGYDGKLFSLESPVAFAPGQPLVLDVQLAMGHRLELKSIGSKQRPEGGYLVRARATTLTKGARAALEGAFGLATK